MKLTKKKLNIWLYKALNRDVSNRLTKKERYAVIIVNKLIKYPGSDMRLHPSMDKFYIKCDPLKMFVVIDMHTSEVSIINHVYGYNVKLSKRALDMVVDNFVAETEKQRLAMEEEYTSNIQYSLRTVSNNIPRKIIETNVN